MGIYSTNRKSLINPDDIIQTCWQWPSLINGKDFPYKGLVMHSFNVSSRQLKQAIEQQVELPVNWDSFMLMWHLCNEQWPQGLLDNKMDQGWRQID